MRRAGLAVSDANAAPTLIAGRYRVEGALGTGGAGQVFRVTDLVRAKELALKRLHAGASKGVTALFELEYQTLAGLKHPRIVEVFEYRRDGGDAFYTMELLEGEDLKDRAPLPWREVCRYVRDAAQALGLLHARRLVHRDVSPRNLWRTPDGRVKLLDFGALTPFGPCTRLVGTPPLVPPEAYEGQELDQRTDLYALGAVAYYLLTGLHAYPARDLRELPELWAYDLVAASQRVAELSRADLDPVPADLDILISALLSLKAVGRPASAAEVIDRLDVLLGNARRSEAEMAQSQLSNVAFVGRVRERRRFKRMLVLAAHGRGQSCVIESEPGLGRSRLLRELALEAQVAPATVLHVDAAVEQGVYGVAGALALKLLEALPQEARALAAPHQAMLAHVSSRLRDQLSVQAPPLAEAGVELRLRMQAALRDWFSSVAEQHPLVVLVDGLELVDDGSAAFLLALAYARKRARLLLVGALVRDRGRQHANSERALLKMSRRLALKPLSDLEALELLRSIFGDAENLSRLASHLQQMARGNPGHLLELCDQLLRRKIIGFAAGSWVLPQELPQTLLSRSRDEALASRLGYLSPGARELGRALSVYKGVLSRELCLAIADSLSQGLFLHLGGLLEAEVLVQERSVVRFAHEQQRLALCTELEPERRRAVERTIGALLLSASGATTLDRLDAGLHLLEGGDPRGADVVAKASLRIALAENDKLKPALPAIERSLSLFREQGRARHELLVLVAALAIGGYLSDWRYAARYGDAALGALERALGLRLARKLSRFFGRKLGLYVALLAAAVRFRLWRKNPRMPDFRQALVLLFSCCTALSGTRALCLDPKSAFRSAEVLEPLMALGPKHIASFVHEYSSLVATTVRDGYAQTYARWQRMIQRLLSSEPIKGLPDSLRVRYLAGALYGCGITESLRDDDRALRAADRLDQLGPRLFKMYADQLRTVYYANQGNRKLFEQYRERTEQNVIQQGTSWQAETWAASTMTTVYLRTQDAMGMKRVSEQLHRLSNQIPSLDPYSRRSRGSYLLLRGKYTEALPWLEEVLQEEPPGIVGWTRTHGSLAAAYNRLGEHQRAKSACQRALRHLQPEDLSFVGMNLSVQLELLIAEAGLGDGVQAQGKLAQLIAVHTPNQGWLTLGQLHDAGVQIALLAKDPVAAKQHFSEMERWYLATGLPSLAERCQVLAGRVHTTQRLPSSARSYHGVTTSDLQTGSGTASLTVERLLAGGAMSMLERARKALQILAENTCCTHGFLYVLDGEGTPQLTAALKEDNPAPEIESWAMKRVALEFQDELTQMDEDDEGDAPRNVLRHDARYYRILTLFAPGAKANGVVGVAVLGSEEEEPTPCPADVLGAVGRHLQRALKQKIGPNSLLG